MRSGRWTYEVLIMDDRSEDGTDQVVQEQAALCPVELVVRDGFRDLSLAVLDGLKRARGNVLLVMDADLSHPPEQIPDLLATLETPGVDFVIGSRFVAGGQTQAWGGHRWLNSYIATLLCRPLARGARDPMSGFFALRRNTYRQAKGFDPIGYKIGLELICRCRCSTIREIPIIFHNRVEGESKLNLRQQSRYLIHLNRLYRDCRPGWGLLFRPVIGLMLALIQAARLAGRPFGIR